MRLKNLERYRTCGTGTNFQLAISVPKTPDGRAYRLSPNENAHPRHFVIGDPVRPKMISDESRARMKILPGSPQTVCPYSGTIAEDGRTALGLGESVGAHDLHGHTDWTLRRFNPALHILLSYVDSQGVRSGEDDEYQTHFFHLGLADRVAIKRFAQSHPRT